MKDNPIIDALRRDTSRHKQEAVGILQEKFEAAREGHVASQEQIVSSLLDYVERQKLANAVPDTQTPSLIANAHLRIAPYTRQEPTS